MHQIQAVDDYVRSGMVVGLGTGSTAYFAVERVGEKVCHSCSHLIGGRKRKCDAMPCDVVFGIIDADITRII
jgi:DNA-binding transcriptional regulator LsrR (DeoR family)